MISLGELPIYMRVGSSDERQIGTVEIDRSVKLTTHEIAKLLREAADALEAESDHAESQGWGATPSS